MMMRLFFASATTETLSAGAGARREGSVRESRRSFSRASLELLRSSRTHTSLSEYRDETTIFISRAMSDYEV